LCCISPEEAANCGVQDSREDAEEQFERMSKYYQQQSVQPFFFGMISFEVEKGIGKGLSEYGDDQQT